MRGRGFWGDIGKAFKTVGRFAKKEVVDPVWSAAKKRLRSEIGKVASKVQGGRRMRGGSLTQRGYGRRRKGRKGLKSLRGRRRVPGSYPEGQGLDFRY